MENAQGNFALVILIFFIFPLLIVLVLSYQIWKNVIRKKWPVVEGVVKSYSIETPIWRDTSGGEMWSVGILISYTVGGTKYTYEKKKHYTKKRRNLIFGGKSREEVKMDIESKYPKGKKVPLYYNPDRPTQTVLKPGIKLKRVILLLFCFLWFLMGVLTTILFY